MTELGSQKVLSLGQERKTLAYWLAIWRCPGMGPRRMAALQEYLGCFAEGFSGTHPRKELVDYLRFNGIVEFIPDWKKVEQDLLWETQSQNHIITLQDAHYPALLKEIALPPPILFVAGKIEVLQSRQLAIVGSRQPTAQGRENAFLFAQALAQEGFIITSGLALGIDGASHEGALAASGATIGVLGTGIDQIYPAKHRALTASIMENGALVSEFALGTLPKPANFPRRNRIISGLSLGTLVVESALNSGSLITASCALDQGREVFAIPGSIHNPLAKGCHHLIRQGAKCVENVEHIVEEFSLLSRVTKNNPKKEPQQKSLPLVSSQSKKEGLPTHLLQVLSHIEEECTPIDLVVERSGLTVEKVAGMLLELEMQGAVVGVPGGYIRVTTGGCA